ncbi:MAG: hypothetical protein AMXMBFR67_37030 [Nitrospira sp.]
MNWAGAQEAIHNCPFRWTNRFGEPKDAERCEDQNWETKPPSRDCGATWCGLR